MIRCSIQEICDATQAELLSGSLDTTIEGVEIDSRNISAGNLFVAFPGERVDGNVFAATALEAGAAAVVLTREPEAGVLETARRLGSAVLMAAPRGEGKEPVEDDATEFVLRLASWWRRAQNWIVVGVTGSVGKTTTKDMLKAALSSNIAGEGSAAAEGWSGVYANVGNHNNLVGVPLTIFEAPADTSVLVCEMGMNHVGEIARLAETALPHVGVITNVGTSHIGMLGSRENIARAKAEMIPWLKKSFEIYFNESAYAASDSVVSKVLQALHEQAPAIYLTAENDFSSFIAKNFAEPAGVEAKFVGEGATSVLSLTSPVELDEYAHPSFSFKANQPLGARCQEGSFEAHLSLTGKQVVPDFLLAFAVAAHLGCEPTAAIAALEALEPTHMRTEVVKAASGARIIDDSYNASPDSVAAALEALLSMKVEEGGRKIAILGEIGELGSEEDRLHELVGAYAAAKNPDMLVIVGTTRADHMEKAAKLMGYSEDKIVRVKDVEALINIMASVLSPADLVLVKASRAAELDKFVKAVCA